MNLEVVVLPVADVDRANGVYEALGRRLDGDFSAMPARPSHATDE